MVQGMSVKNVKEMQPTSLEFNLVQIWRSQMDGQMDGWADRQTDKPIPVYPHHYIAGGIITTIATTLVLKTGYMFFFCMYKRIALV